MSKSTSSSAVTPPNLIVTLSTASRALPRAVRVSVSDIDALPFQLVDPGLRTDRSPCPAWRQDALWPEVDDQHQREAEDQQSPVTERPEPLGQIGHQAATQHRTPSVAGAADDHRGEEQHREQDQEARRVDV